MASKIRICEAGVEDINDSVKELWLQLAREMFKIEGLVLPSEENANRWIGFVRKTLNSQKSLLMLAKSGSGPVGFVYASISRDFPLDVSKPTGRIDDLYVLPDYRGRGIGEELVLKCLNKMRVAGVKAIRLRVLAENKAAMELYKKLDFKTYNYGMMKLFS